MYVQYTYINNVNLYNIYIYSMQFLCTHYMYDSCTLHIQLADLTFEQTELRGHLSMWKSSSHGICLVGDFLRIRVGNHHFTTISRNIFPFCSHPTNCNEQIQVSNTARIRFRVPYDPQQISLNQQKHRFISPIRCAFRDEHRFPAGFTFHGKVPVICVSKNPCYPFKNRKCLGLSFSYLNIKHLALFFLNVKIKQ